MLYANYASIKRKLPPNPEKNEIPIKILTSVCVTQQADYKFIWTRRARKKQNAFEKDKARGSDTTHKM